MSTVNFAACISVIPSTAFLRLSSFAVFWHLAGLRAVLLINTDENAFHAEITAPRNETVLVII